MSLYKFVLTVILIILINGQVKGFPGLYLRPYNHNGNGLVHKFGYGYKPSEASNIGETVPEERRQLPVPEAKKVVKRNIPSYLPSNYVQSQMAYPQAEYVQPADIYGMQGQRQAAPIMQVPPEFQYAQYPHTNPSFPQRSYPLSGFGYPDISDHTIYTDYLKTEPEYLGQERYYPGIYPHGHPNVQIRPAFGHGYPNCVFYLPSKIPTPQGEINVELVNVRPYKPGTEHLGKVPIVKSIEMIKITKGEKIGQEMDEDNEI